MTLKEKLIEELKKQGLNEGLADLNSITTEDQIEGVIAKLKPTQPSQREIDFSSVLASQEFSEFVNSNGLEGVLKHSKTLQGLTDKKVTKGVQTAMKKYLTTLDSEGDTNILNDKQSNSDDGIPEWAKNMLQKIDGLEKKTQTSIKLEKAKEALEKSDIPKEFYKKYEKRFDLNSEQSFEDQAKNFETEIIDYQRFFVGDNAGKGLLLGKKVDTSKQDKEDLKNLGKQY